MKFMYIDLFLHQCSVNVEGIQVLNKRLHADGFYALSTDQELQLLIGNPQSGGHRSNFVRYL